MWAYEIKEMEKMDETARNFIDAFVQEDLSEGNRCYGMQVHTRFPP